MPRHKYKTKDARRRHTTFQPELTEYEIMMSTEDGKISYMKVKGSSGVNAWTRAIRQGLEETPVRFPVEITRGNEWKYTAF